MPQITVGERPSLAHWLRFAWNLVNLSSLLGLAVAGVGRAKLDWGPRGLVFAEGFRYDFPRAGAFTVGNLVITRHTMAQLETWHPGTLDHEDTHAWQWGWMLGLPYLPVYWLLCGWSWLRTGDPASRNFFERHAGLTRGGYRERPVTNAGFRMLGRALTGRK